MIPRQIGAALGAVGRKADGNWRTEWLEFSQAGALNTSSHGATVSQSSAGVYVIVWSQPFGNNNYPIWVTSDENRVGCVLSKTSTGCTVQTRNDTSTLTDPAASVSVLAMGR